MKHLRTLVLIVALLLGVVATVGVQPERSAEAISGSGVNILYAPSEADNAGFRGAISGITGGTTDYFDAITGTPDAATLSGYDCVFVWTNFAHADATLYGDNLADFVDAGGVVVLGAFTTYTNGNSLAGRIMTSGYSPVTSPSGNNLFTFSTYNGDGTTLIWDGVASYNTDYPDDVVLQGSGIADGTLDTPILAAAYRPDYQVVFLNGAGDPGFISGGDTAQLVANACSLYDPTPPEVPPALHVPNQGLVQINAHAPVQPYGMPGMELQNFMLPADYDGNGFDTYVVTEVTMVDGEYWLGIFIGNDIWLWVPYSSVQVLTPIAGIN